MFELLVLDGILATRRGTIMNQTVIHLDISSSTISKKGGIGVVIQHRNGKKITFSETHTNVTAQQLQVMATVSAIDRLAPGESAVVCSTQTYIASWFDAVRSRQPPKTNKDLYGEFAQKVKAHRVRLETIVAPREAEEAKALAHAAYSPPKRKQKYKRKEGVKQRVQRNTS